MSTEAAAPDWRGLLAIGLDRLRDVRSYAWFFAVMIALAFLQNATVRLDVVGTLVTISAAVASLYATLVLARRLMTGQLTAWQQDLRNLVRLLIVSLFAGLVLLLPVIALTTILAAAVGSWTAPTIVGLIVFMAALYYFIARSALFLPALAIDDPTTFWRSFDQGRLYWGRLLSVFLIIFAVPIALVWAFREIVIPWPISAVIEGLVNAASILLMESAACYIYWRHARGTA